MSIEEELQDQLDYLKLPTTKWVRGMPGHKDRACLVVRNAGDAGLGMNAGMWLAKWLDFGGYVKRNDPTSPFFLPATYWNDKVASGKEQVIEVLEKAIAAAGEEGV